MSSHHIVRDNQEPALWVRQAHATDFGLIEDLLEWSPFVIVDASEVDVFVSRGIKVDAIVTKDALTDPIERLLKDQWPVAVIHHHDPATAVFQFLQKRNQQAINMVAKAEPLFQVLEKSPLQTITVLDGTTRWSLIRQGHFEKYLPSGTSVKVFVEGAIHTLQPTNQRVHLSYPVPFWVGEELFRAV